MEGRGEKQGLEIRLRDDDRRTGEIVGEIVFWDDDGRRRLQLEWGTRTLMNGSPWAS